MDINKYKIKKSNADIETHHVFLDTLAHSKEEEMGIFEKKFSSIYEPIREAGGGAYFVF